MKHVAAYREEAARFRRAALRKDPKSRDYLLDMANHYDRLADEREAALMGDRPTAQVAAIAPIAE
jgi:hypothetical protein